MKHTAWLDRQFPILQDSGLLPNILERLEGTPLRAESIITGISAETLVLKQNGKWSVQEELGHISDLEPLWIGRINDYILGESMLRAADLSNQNTDAANHNAKEISTILKEFKIQRQEFVLLIRNLNTEQIDKSSLHPRLKTPMRIVDFAYFVAEHDDHHLAKVREIILANLS